MGDRKRAMAGSLYDQSTHKKMAGCRRAKVHAWLRLVADRLCLRGLDAPWMPRKSPTEKVREPELKYLLTLYPVLNKWLKVSETR